MVFYKTGSIVFSWAKGKLMVKLSCKDTGYPYTVGQIGAPGFKGLYEDTSEGGTKPSGSVPLTGEPLDCSVTIGGSEGNRKVLISGTSSTTVKFVGNWEWTLENVKLIGTTGTVVVP